MNKESAEIIFSVIIPVYNIEAYIYDCLLSIIQQSFCEFEIICVIDGSTDKSIDICRLFERRDNRIRIIVQENKGLSGARNCGVNAAKGRYILFVDGDDILSDNALEELYKHIELNDLDIITFNVDPFLEKECNDKEMIQLCEYLRISFCETDIITGRDLFVKKMRMNGFQDMAWLLCVSVDFINANQIRFVEGIVSEDHLYSIECYLKARYAKHINENIYKYRIRSGSLGRIKRGRWRLYSLTTIFAGLMNFIVDYGNDSEVINYLCKSADEIADEIRTVDYYLLDKEKQELSENKIVEPLYRLAQIGPYSKSVDCFQNRQHIRAFLDVLRNSHSVYLYGSGHYGKLLYNYLSGKGITNIIGFINSNTPQNGECVMGIPVYGISQIDVIQECIVVISTGMDLQEEIYSLCKEYGIKNIWRLDRVLMEAIEKTK